VMAEFLLRGYNVAMPEVDVGDDIIVVNDWAEQLWRIQVKTANGVKRGYGYSGQFLVPLDQLTIPQRTPLFYFFALRRNGGWEFVVLKRDELLVEYTAHQIGSRSGDKLLLYLAFKANQVLCANRDFQRYRNNWSRWPVIVPA
jgi:hypothetical protein